MNPVARGVINTVFTAFVGIPLFRDRPATPGKPSTEIPATVVIIGTRVIPGDYFELPLGTERRTINNRQSMSSVEREVKVRRAWRKQIELTGGAELGISGGVGASIPTVADFRSSAQAKITAQLKSSDMEEQSLEETVKVTVPPRTSVEVAIDWKIVWQAGKVVFDMSDGSTRTLPYRETIGLTFDQEHRDVN